MDLHMFYETRLTFDNAIITLNEDLMGWVNFITICDKYTSGYKKAWMTQDDNAWSFFFFIAQHGMQQNSIFSLAIIWPNSQKGCKSLSTQAHSFTLLGFSKAYL